MKSINFIAGLLIVSLAISCSGSKKQVKNKEQYPDIEDNSSARQYRNAHTNIIEKNKKFKEAIEKQQALAAQNDTVILSIERTPCFGRCPVFELKVYKNGYTTFEGKMNTDKQGLYMCNTKKEVLDSIFLRANTINFFNLQDEYDSPVTDLPSAYLYINMDGKTKKIHIRHQVPLELSEFLYWVDKTLNANEWLLIKKAEENR